LQINNDVQNNREKIEKIEKITAPSVIAILVAAGAGRRFGAEKNKVLLPLLGKPVLAWSLQKLDSCSAVTGIIVVAAEYDLEEIKQIVAPYQKVRRIALGGNFRQDSVFRGLWSAGEDYDLTLIHDAARPLLPTERLPELIAMIDDYCQGAILAVPVRDTIKEAVFRGNERRVNATLDRDKLFAAQTPQVFDRKILFAAHEYAKKESFLATDDAQLLEHYGYSVKILEGSPENVKITTIPDMLLAELLLKRGSDTL